MASGDPCITALYLIQCALDQLMRNRSRKQNHKIRPADRLNAAELFGKYLCLALIFLTKIHILPHHTFISSDNHNAHWIISPHKVPGLLRHTPQPVDISGSQADPRHQELCVSRLVSHVPHSWGSLLLQELALTNYRIAYI